MPSKVRTLTEMAKDGKTIGFVVHTPGSERGVTTQSVLLRKAEVKRTHEGHHIITGRDLQLEAEAGRISKDTPVIRSFRIDRIVNRTIVSK